MRTDDEAGLHRLCAKGSAGGTPLWVPVAVPDSRAVQRPGLAHAATGAPCAGLYAERVGAINFVLADPKVAARVLSQVKRIARALWSNPPVHGEPCP